MGINQERLALLKKRLNNYYEAEEAILLNQEYTIGTKNLKRADLGTVRAAIREITAEIELMEAGGKNRMRRVIPKD